MCGQMRQVGLGLCGMLVVVGTAGAQVIPMSLAEMVSAADTIVVAEAIDSRAEWVTTGSSRVIVTRMTFRVTDTLKGTQRLLLPLEFLGARSATWDSRSPGCPRSTSAIVRCCSCRARER